MSILLNLDLLSVGFVIAATGILGFAAFFSNPKSITNKTFLTFCILTIAWGLLNLLSYRIHTPELALWVLRLAIATAVWHTLFLFKMLYVFPEEDIAFPKSYQTALLPLVLCASLLNLTPFTFKGIAEVSNTGQITQVANGPGIILFTFIILALIISGIVVFIKKIKAGKNISSKQGRPVLVGIIITFALILIFNFVYPAFLGNSRYISLGAVFIFPFILGTGYSIFRHKFLDLKVISTEILTFVLAMVIMLEVIASTDYITLIFRISIFFLVVCLGILLIKSVIREVKQREQLEILTEELANANEQLKVLDKARAEFITIASHQLRTPPATIKWYLSSILQGDFGKVDEELKTALDKTNRTNNSLISLIDDMLNVSRIERGKMEFLFELSDLLNLAQITFEQLEPIAKEKGLKLIFNEPKQKPPQIMADKEKVRQVMNNMIDNALKYTKQGSVTINFVFDQNEIKFSVTDTGKGMSPEEHEEIFEKFKRGKESARHSAGLGLGLYVAKVIIEQHKGKIWAQSQGEGKGSSFIFSLPINNGLKETTLVDFTKNQT